VRIVAKTTGAHANTLAISAGMLGGGLWQRKFASGTVAHFNQSSDGSNCSGFIRWRDGSVSRGPGGCCQPC
jgi:hypothetical protein